METAGSGYVGLIDVLFDTLLCWLLALTQTRARMGCETVKLSMLQLGSVTRS